MAQGISTTRRKQVFDYLQDQRTLLDTRTSNIGYRLSGTHGPTVNEAERESRIREVVPNQHLEVLLQYLNWQGINNLGRVRELLDARFQAAELPPVPVRPEYSGLFFEAQAVAMEATDEAEMKGATDKVREAANLVDTYQAEVEAWLRTVKEARAVRKAPDDKLAREYPSRSVA